MKNYNKMLNTAVISKDTNSIKEAFKDLQARDLESGNTVKELTGKDNFKDFFNYMKSRDIK